ncbi:Uncharacterised protein [uncultured archaeon]|nr:Uncharacterised protein [uncultured archaeon]
MLIKVLGVIDFIAGLLLIFGAGTKLPWLLLLFFGVGLLLKSTLGKLKDFASWIDFLCGINLILLLIFSVPVWISIILGILLVQKGIFSFL